MKLMDCFGDKVLFFVNYSFLPPIIIAHFSMQLLTCSIVNGLVRKSSIPEAMHMSLSIWCALAVMAIIKGR